MRSSFSVFPESFSEPAECRVPAFAFLAKVEANQEQGMNEGDGTGPMADRPGRIQGLPFPQPGDPSQVL